MQRAAYHHQMASNAPPTGASCYSQGYNPASAYHAFHNNMDYHHAMSTMPSMSAAAAHHNQLGASMSSAALNQMANSHAAAAGHMTSHAMTSAAHGLHSAAAMHRGNYGSVKDDCLDYQLDKSTPIASAAAAASVSGDWKAQFQML